MTKIVDQILIVDDEKNMLITLESILSDQGYHVAVASGGAEALTMLKETQPAVVITDLKMDAVNGFMLMQRAKEMYPDLPVIMMTAYATPKSAVEAIKQGAFDYIPKPFDPEELLFSVERALNYEHMRRENIALKKTLRREQALEHIIGNEPSIVQLRNQIAAIAPTKATVLIEGESGTGKELVARAIHDLSQQKDGPFIAINCAAIPESLLESELFGHVKGAFTGAYETKIGKFEAASEGTMYLDEIGDMNIALQSKILRVLEGQEFTRVGANEPIFSQCRVIAATNKDLKEMIIKGLFREDLYFRLNVINIHLPALRDRSGDLPLLIDHFIRILNIEYSKNIEGVDVELMRILSLYHWRGNIRELKNVIERAVILSNASMITKDVFPKEMFISKNKLDATMAKERIDFNHAVAEFEMNLIIWALKKTQYRVGHAADELGITRHALRHYLKKYNIQMRDNNA
ncbi:MAG: sigma-54 dependent transcriptional regulator [Chlamydiota bacterium]|nr:sigma-54 dependent transcriptional regulator [Chlamydiota bacterium]